MPKTAHAKTRNKIASHLSSLVGTGREFIPSELPTHRDLLRYGILCRELAEENRRNYTVNELVRDMIPPLLAQWQKANSQFKYPVINHEERLFSKVKKLWDDAVKASLGKGKLVEKQRFISKLDKLVDILNCKCPIKLCTELGCVKEGEDRCKKDAHAECNCEREFKIPQLELAFVRAQRVKEGSAGSLHIGGSDIRESRRQMEALKNKEKEKTAKEKAADKRKNQSEEAARREQEACEFMNDGGDVLTQDRDRDEEFNLVPPPEAATTVLPTRKYNTMEIPNTALASMRHHTGLRETAEIATAALIDAGVITEEDTNLVIDHNKVKRAQEKLTKELERNSDKTLSENGVSCILFDGRIDDTKIMLVCDDSDRQFPGLIKEEHYSVCQEPGGKYLFHFVPDKATAEKKHAEVIAEKIVNWLVEKRLDKTLLAIGGDSTNVNTGSQGGAMHWVEEKLGRRLVWLVCDLHTGELPLRKLITELDGPTLSHNRWSGPIGQLLDTATELEVDPKFTKIDAGPPLIQLRQEVIKDLSTDQSYAYKITEAIRTGQLSKTLANLEIGPVNHSRWLTTACRLCRIWISKHGLSKKDVQKLKLIVEFIVCVYIPNWFNIKMKHSWVEGARHVLYQLELLRSQNKKVIGIVMPTVKRGAWYAHPESVLQTMLCSEVEQERRFAVDKIVELRGEGDEDTQVGDRSVRDRKAHDINEHATKLADLIDWSEKLTEPPLTCSLTTKNIKEFVASPMKVPDWPSHTQSVERLVKRVTEASAHVYSHGRRDGYIRSQEASAELMSKNRSKQDMVSLVKFRN